jgi:hypothetical protein
LVIGNAQYTQIGVLPRSEADAQDLVRVLRGLGFQVHGDQALLNRSAQALQKDVEDFQKTIAAGDEVVFYFSGHGVTHEILGNLLVPVDAPALNRLAPPGRLLQQYLGVNDTLKAIADMKPRVLVSILDACRTFPTVKPNGKSDVPSVGLQSTPPPATAGVEQLVMYAAAHGQEALAYLDNGQDRNGRNSVFTRVLLQEMVRPNPSVNQLAYSVAQRVYAMTKTEKDGAQNVEYRSVPTDTPPFSFVPLAAQAAAPSPPVDTAKDAEIARLREQLAQAQRPVVTAVPRDVATAGPSEPVAKVSVRNAAPMIDGYEILDDPVLGQASLARDPKTGLVWQRCSVGQSWDGAQCIGEVAMFTFKGAQTYETDSNDWRVPTIMELQTLIDCNSGAVNVGLNSPRDSVQPLWVRCEGKFSAPTIKRQLFPNTYPSGYWSTSSNYPQTGMLLAFDRGRTFENKISEGFRLRLVRASQ